MAAAALGLFGALAWQAHTLQRATAQGRALVAAARPFQHRPERPRRRVLVLGDSIGVGVGAGRAGATLPGLLAEAYPDAEIVNRAANGARVADALEQLVPLAHERFDLVLVLAGGNDVLRATPAATLSRDAARLLAACARVARRTVWLGPANLGGSPVLLRPLAWWFTWKSARAMRCIAAEARRAGALFIDFFRPRRDDPIARRTGIYFAGDGLHPSAASHRLCFDTLRRRAPLDALLGSP